MSLLGILRQLPFIYSQVEKSDTKHTLLAVRRYKRSNLNYIFNDSRVVCCCQRTI
jgi:hypothetical protein